MEKYIENKLFTNLKQRLKRNNPKFSEQKLKIHEKYTKTQTSSKIPFKSDPSQEEPIILATSQPQTCKSLLSRTATCTTRTQTPSLPTAAHPAVRQSFPAAKKAPAKSLSASTLAFVPPKPRPFDFSKPLYHPKAPPPPPEPVVVSRRKFVKQSGKSFGGHGFEVDVGNVQKVVEKRRRSRDGSRDP